jgi:hypothetical protein
MVPEEKKDGLGIKSLVNKNLVKILKMHLKILQTTAKLTHMQQGKIKENLLKHFTQD